MKKTVLLLAALTMLALSMTACGGNNGAAPSPTTGSPPATGGAVSAAEAETLVKANCIACHGAELQGAGAPGLSKIGGKYSAEQIHDIVANGQGGMPSFKGTLTDGEIQSIAAWLAEKK